MVSPLSTLSQQSSASLLIAESVVTLPSMMGRCRKSILRWLMRVLPEACARLRMRCASLM